MTIFPIVAVSALTAMRLREVLALRWVDVDLGQRIIAVTRAIEETKGKRGIKAPKTARGVRAFEIDEHLAALLIEHRQKYLRLVAGIPDGAEADLSLIKLPKDALLFPGGDGVHRPDAVA